MLAHVAEALCLVSPSLSTIPIVCLDPIHRSTIEMEVEMHMEPELVVVLNEASRARMFEFAPHACNCN